MFNNVALDVFIGLVFIFLLYSLLATIVQEMIATSLAFRSKVLEKAILRMLEDGKTTSKFKFGDRVKGFLHMFGVFNFLSNKSITPWFYAHPLIKYLGEDNYFSKPAYLDSKNFSKVLVDLLKGIETPESESVQSIHDSISNGTINKLPINTSDSGNPALREIFRQMKLAINSDPKIVKINPDTAVFIRSLWQEAGADLDKFKLKLEEWFDATMDRASGWYKRYTQFILFILGFIMAYIFNVDAIAVKRILAKDKTAREQLVQIAINNKDTMGERTNTVKGSPSDSVLKITYQSVLSDAQEANNILGLGKPWKDTCSLCDSYKTKDGNYKFQTLIDSLNKIQVEPQSGRIKNLKDSITQLDGIMKSIDTTNKSLFEKARDSLGKKIKKLNDSIEIYNQQSGQNNREENVRTEIARLIVLDKRCPVIAKAREQKWNLYSPKQSGGWETFFGWIITAFAISLGAPFWFDLLNKIVKIRGGGTKITSEPSVATKDEKSAATQPVTINVNPNPGEEAVG
jgi:hypothetical protein